MIERNDGHLIHVGSTAEKRFIQKVMYCASKHAVDALNKGCALISTPTIYVLELFILALYKTEFSEVRFKGDTHRANKDIKAMKLYKGRHC